MHAHSSIDVIDSGARRKAVDISTENLGKKGVLLFFEVGHFRVK